MADRTRFKLKRIKAGEYSVIVDGKRRGVARKVRDSKWSATVECCFGSAIRPGFFWTLEDAARWIADPAPAHVATGA